MSVDFRASTQREAIQALVVPKIRDIARVFAAVLAVCDAPGLIGREMFAIDVVKLPRNASKQ